MMNYLRKTLWLLLLTSCGNLEGDILSPSSAASQKKAPPRAPQKALADAKQNAEALLKDASKADAWRKSTQTDLKSNIDHAAPAGKADKQRAAAAAAAHAYDTTQKDPDQNLAHIVDHATQCAIQCREASAQYAKSGTRLAKLNDVYSDLKKRLEALEKHTATYTPEQAAKASNAILAEVRSIIVHGCIDTMLGKYHEVTMDGKLDKKATADSTDRLFGKASKVITQEALNVWNTKVEDRATKKLTTATGQAVHYKFNLAVAADRKAVADVLRHLTILLVEALKAHYEAKDGPETPVTF